MIHASLGPGIEAAGVNNDLTRRVQFHVRPVHGPGRRPFKVNSFRRVPAAMARALKLVLRRFPVGCAAQMRAAPEDDEDAVAFANYPDARCRFETLIDTWLEIRWVANLENRAGFKKCARKEEAEEHQKISSEKTPNTTPDDSAPHFREGEVSSAAVLAFEGGALGAGLAGAATAGTGALVGVGVAASPAFAITGTSWVGLRDYLIR